MSEQPIRPAGWWYGAAVLVLLAGIGVFVALVFGGVKGIGQNFTQIVVPGEQEVQLDPGMYTIFHEYRSTVGGRVYSNPAQIAGLQVQVKSKTTGGNIAVAPSSVQSNYNVGSREGKSLLEFRIDQPGTYILSGDYAGGATGPQTVLAVGIR